MGKGKAGGAKYLQRFKKYNSLYIKYIVIAGIWIFGMIMIKLYAPADTEAVPILAKKDRRKI